MLSQKDDLRAIVNYLREDGNVSLIGLWGRSMGAVTRYTSCLLLILCNYSQVFLCATSLKLCIPRYIQQT